MHVKINNVLQGWVQFPTGGEKKVREPFWLIWCESKTDSTVWMREEMMSIECFRALIFLSGLFLCSFFMKNVKNGGKNDNKNK